VPELLLFQARAAAEAAAGADGVARVQRGHGGGPGEGAGSGRAGPRPPRGLRHRVGAGLGRPQVSQQMQTETTIIDSFAIHPLSVV
jgi:hypothetical protein